MPLHQNNDLRSLPAERGKGVAGTAIIYFAVLLLLLLIGFSAPVPPAEEGIIVNFGTDETGMGLVEPSPSSSPSESSVPPPQAEENPSAEEPVVTQDFDKEAPEIKKTDPEAERKKKEALEAERIRQAELEAQRIKRAQEEAERKRIEDEQRKIAEITNKTKNALAGAKNTTTASTGEGIAGGVGNQGVTTGSVDSNVRGPGGGTGDKGISYDLAGRNFQSLPKPEYIYQGDGKVVVEITVDRNGNVTQANPGVKGSTTLDDYLLKVAKDAALKAKFEAKPDAPTFQKGTITYTFVLN